jgi:transcriptional regulator with XRE-family HTH domain
MTRKLDAARSPLAFYGAELRRLRQVAGWSQDRCGDEMGFSGDLVGKVETVTRPPTADFTRHADRVFTALWPPLDRHFARLRELAIRAGYEEWFQDWVDAEREATELQWWEQTVVPGLLQTREYARAILRAGRPGDTDEMIEQQTEARMERQAILAKEDPPFLWSVMDEDVLRRCVGSRETMRDQCAHLLKMSGNPRIRILIVPRSVGAHAGLAAGFVIASFSDAADLVYQAATAQGRITGDPAAVRQCALAFDTLRAEALSPRASAELIAEVMESWT